VPSNAAVSSATCSCGTTAGRTNLAACARQARKQHMKCLDRQAARHMTALPTYTSAKRAAEMAAHSVNKACTLSYQTDICLAATQHPAVAPEVNMQQRRRARYQ
jgi:hypothetical protein